MIIDFDQIILLHFYGVLAVSFTVPKENMCWDESYTGFVF